LFLCTLSRHKDRSYRSAIDARSSKKEVPEVRGLKKIHVIKNSHYRKLINK